MLKEKPKTRGFLSIGLVGTSLLLSIIKAIMGGVVYATVAFFTKEGWERWKSKGKN